MIFRGKKVLVWSINNYIGLCNHPEVRKVDTESTKKWGMGSGYSGNRSTRRRSRPLSGIQSVVRHKVSPVWKATLIRCFGGVEIGRHLKKAVVGGGGL